MLTASTMLERQAEALSRALCHVHQESRDSKPTTPLIVLARESGTPASAIAEALGARLNWPVYDQELLRKISADMGLRVSLLESVDEQHQNWLAECVEAFVSAPHVSEERYVRHLAETLFSLNATGHCVIVGRGAAHLLPGDHILRVRLVGNIEDRIRAVAERRKLSYKEATRVVHETDREQQRFVKEYFLVDPTEPRSYDLILNTSRWTVSDCTDMIIQGLHHLETRLHGSHV